MATRKSVWRLALPIAVLLAAAGCEDDNGPAPGPVVPPPQPGPYFTVYPVADATIVSIAPLGNLNPPGHVLPTDHLYTELPLAAPGLPAIVPMVSPGAIVVTEVERQRNLTDGITDYGLHFHPVTSHLFLGRFGHMYDLAPALAAALSAGTPSCQTYMAGGKDFEQCRFATSITLAAGEPLGNTGGNPGQFALDFFAYDSMQAPAAYANPARYTNSELRYAVCAIDYFFDPPRGALESRLGAWGGGSPRTVPPVCGTVAQDVPGTAQGNWFREGYPDLYPEDNHLALVHDNADPTAPVFSVGTRAVTLASGTYRYVPAPTGLVNRDFADITADGNTYCFDTAELAATAIVLVHMPDAATLWLERQNVSPCGGPPWTMTASKAVYLR